MGSCGKGFGRGRRSCFLIWVFVGLGLSSLWGSGCAQVETHASTMLHVTTTRHKEVYVTLVSVYFLK